MISASDIEKENALVLLDDRLLFDMGAIVGVREDV